MIVLGVVLVVLSLLVPQLAVLFWIGIIIGVVGLVLLIAGSNGHPVGGRRWYF